MAIIAKGGLAIDKSKAKRLYFNAETNNKLRDLALLYKSESEAAREAIRRLYEAEQSRIKRIKKVLGKDEK